MAGSRLDLRKSRVPGTIGRKKDVKNGADCHSVSFQNEEEKMERLTKVDKQGRLLAYSISETGLPVIVMKGNPYRKIIERLEAYEDTGLEPEKIEELGEKNQKQKMSKPNPNTYCCPECDEALFPMWDYCPWCGQHVD